jgi:hypothetical protein
LRRDYHFAAIYVPARSGPLESIQVTLTSTRQEEEHPIYKTVRAESEPSTDYYKVAAAIINILDVKLFLCVYLRIYTYMTKTDEKQRKVKMAASLVGNLLDRSN